jgi:ribosomal protein L15
MERDQNLNSRYPTNIYGRKPRNMNRNYNNNDNNDNNNKNNDNNDTEKMYEKKIYRQTKAVFGGLRVDENNSSRILGYMPATPGKDKTRKGRGTGSGVGNFSTRGCKGQGQRGSAKPGFEGGQTPAYKRIPKRGFTSPHKNTIDQTKSVPLSKIINLMNTNKITNITSEQILDLCNAPFYFKSVKIIGHVGDDQILTSINIECESISSGAKQSLEKNNSRYTPYNRYNNKRNLQNPDNLNNNDNLI